MDARTQNLMINRTEDIIHKYVGASVEVNLREFLKTHGVTDLMVLENTQKRELVERILKRFVQPRVSIGKTSLARVEIESILGLREDQGIWKKGREGGKEKPVEEHKVEFSLAKPVRRDPWSITADYVPNPKQFLLENDMRAEFAKIQKQLFKEILSSLKREDLKNAETRFKVLDTAVTKTFGHMGHKAMAYGGESGGGQLKWVVDSNLGTYMKQEKAEDTTNVFMELAHLMFRDGMLESADGKDEKFLSQNLMDYFKDTNQVMLRQIKNKLNVGEKDLTSDTIRKQVLMEVMPYYFGLMSKRYLDKASQRIQENIMQDLGDKEKVQLMAAVIYDCLCSTMTEDKAKDAYSNMMKLIGV
jgi:hypothetical protein